MSDLLKILSRHKGKAGVSALVCAALCLSLTRGCRFTVDIDPVRARTNNVSPQLVPAP